LLPVTKAALLPVTKAALLPVTKAALLPVTKAALLPAAVVAAGAQLVAGVARQPEAQQRMLAPCLITVGLVEAALFINVAFWPYSYSPDRKVIPRHPRFIEAPRRQCPAHTTQ
jgi:F0F1-type ATP synthase membrane subunit c/vacuolar-type H+-ATPase subunit K